MNYPKGPCDLSGLRLSSLRQPKERLSSQERELAWKRQQRAMSRLSQRYPDPNVEPSPAVLKVELPHVIDSPKSVSGRSVEIKPLLKLVRPPQRPAQEGDWVKGLSDLPFSEGGPAGAVLSQHNQFLSDIGNSPFEVDGRSLASGARRQTSSFVVSACTGSPSQRLRHHGRHSSQPNTRLLVRVGSQEMARSFQSPPSR